MTPGLLFWILMIFWLVFGLVQTYIPMAPPIKTIITIVVCCFCASGFSAYSDRPLHHQSPLKIYGRHRNTGRGIVTRGASSNRLNAGRALSRSPRTPRRTLNGDRREAAEDGKPSKRGIGTSKSSVDEESEKAAPSRKRVRRAGKRRDTHQATRSREDSFKARAEALKPARQTQAGSRLPRRLKTQSGIVPLQRN
jgi:hypothetical protein